MSLVGLVRGYWRRAAGVWLERRLSRQPLKSPLGRSCWNRSLGNPTSFYLECVRYFYQKLPGQLRQHRLYFHNVPGNRRGFGENAFHVMWYLLLEEFKPANFLEIGVYRGQVVSLIALWARLNHISCSVYGVSPFSPAGDAVSKYRSDINYYEDTLANFDHFNLPHPQLLKAYSTDPAAVELIGTTGWEMVYIDGNHDYEVARKDWEVCSRNVKPGGIIVLDDAALNTAYRPPACLASRGHPGPSRLTQEIDPSKFREILQVGHNRAFQKISS